MVKEEEEADLMAIADEESRRLREYDKALLTLDRIILGYRGRKLARERRREARLEEVIRLHRVHGSTNAIHARTQYIDQNVEKYQALRARVFGSS